MSAAGAMKFNSDTRIIPMDGTSMATPHVTGAVALLLELNGEMHPKEIEQALISYAAKDVLQNNLGTGSPNVFLNIQKFGKRGEGFTTVTTTTTTTPKPESRRRRKGKG